MRFLTVGRAANDEPVNGPPSPKSWIKTARYEDNKIEATMAARYESMPTSPLNVVIQHFLADLTMLSRKIKAALGVLLVVGPE
ncbi:MAG: hypothetical protein L0211_00415 [Planctomycetaceae bacterium]|nr:hypothetical protein [Planctomycetaceae bacterium]